MSTRELSLGRSLTWIALSTLLISGSAAVAWLGWHYVRGTRSTDPRYQVARIAQAGPLSTDYLAELLDLSAERKTPIDDIRVEQAQQRLLQSPWILDATVRKKMPDTLQIDYVSVVPVARLGQDPAMGVDADGHTFPLQPLFSGEELPLLYAPGLLREAIEVCRLALEMGLPVRAIDLSRLEASSAGRREIVITLRGARGILLRLPIRDWMEALHRFQLLDERPISDLRNPSLDSARVLVVDLRLDHLAFLKYEHSLHRDSLDER